MPLKKIHIITLTKKTILQNFAQKLQNTSFYTDNLYAHD